MIEPDVHLDVVNDVVAYNYLVVVLVVAYNDLDVVLVVDDNQVDELVVLVEEKLHAADVVETVAYVVAAAVVFLKIFVDVAVKGGVLE